ncbi:CHRNN [Mytilus coruscus]|uniref:CHRNN n=1 Tax=Mytilus coruscus TaxID=42192 RepID=A0A6J8EM44_MYTCO|nr:CHRNN [Mytilus coruscus]
MKFRNIGLLIPLLAFINIVHAQTSPDLKSLHTDLFNNYKKEVLPIENPSKRLEIGVAFYLNSLNSFNEVEESISVTGAMLFNWTDSALKWNHTMYGNVAFTVIDSKDLWLPSIFLVNRIDSMNPVGDGIKFPATITATGEVAYFPGGIINAKCQTDISKFPFDRQTCTLTFVPWGFMSPQLTLNSIYDEAQLIYFSPHSDWKLEKYSTRTNINYFGYSLFYVELTIKREPLYFAVMIIVPTLLFSLLNPLVFVLPVESGERVSLSVTLLLSYTIFLTLASASIPTSSNPMCVLLIVMVAMIGISGTIVIGTIVSAKYFYLENNKNLGYIMNYLIGRFNKRKKSVAPIDENNKLFKTAKDGRQFGNQDTFALIFLTCRSYCNRYYCAMLETDTKVKCLAQSYL